MFGKKSKIININPFICNPEENILFCGAGGSGLHTAMVNELINKLTFYMDKKQVPQIVIIDPLRVEFTYIKEYIEDSVYISTENELIQYLTNSSEIKNKPILFVISHFIGDNYYEIMENEETINLFFNFIAKNNPNILAGTNILTHSKEIVKFEELFNQSIVLSISERNIKMDYPNENSLLYKSLTTQGQGIVFINNKYITAPYKFSYLNFEGQKEFLKEIQSYFNIIRYNELLIPAKKALEDSLNSGSEKELEEFILQTNRQIEEACKMGRTWIEVPLDSRFPRGENINKYMTALELAGYDTIKMVPVDRTHYIKISWR